MARLSELHSLACTGPTPGKGCVCAEVAIEDKERIAIVAPFLDEAAAKEQKRALELVQSVEAILGRYRALPNVPLDLIDRCERELVKTHAHNLLQLPTFIDAEERVEGGRMDRPTTQESA